MGGQPQIITEIGKSRKFDFETIRRLQTRNIKINIENPRSYQGIDYP